MMLNKNISDVLSEVGYTIEHENGLSHEVIARVDIEKSTIIINKKSALYISLEHYEHVSTISLDELALLVFFLKDTRFTPTIATSQKINALLCNLLSQLEKEIESYKEHEELKTAEQNSQLTAHVSEVAEITNSESDIQIRHKKIIEKCKSNDNWNPFGYHVNCPYCNDSNHKIDIMEYKPVIEIDNVDSLKYSRVCNDDGKIRVNGNNYLLKELRKKNKFTCKVAFDIKDEEYRMISKWALSIPDNVDGSDLPEFPTVCLEEYTVNGSIREDGIRLIQSRVREYRKWRKAYWEWSSNNNGVGYFNWIFSHSSYKRLVASFVSNGITSDKEIIHNLVNGCFADTIFDSWKDTISEIIKDETGVSGAKERCIELKKLADSKCRNEWVRVFTINDHTPTVKEMKKLARLDKLGIIRAILKIEYTGLHKDKIYRIVAGINK